MNLIEVFTSIQGEGLYIGQPQIFIRFAGCNLRCQFCDTPQALSISPECPITTLNKNITIPNPVTIHSLVNLIKEDVSIYSTICLTGGEPLLEVNPLLALITKIKKEYPTQIHLETNGTLPHSLEQIIDIVDVIAMDIKLPSLTGLRPFWEKHRDFLRIANKKEVFVKIVLGHQFDIDEFMQAISLIKTINKHIPLILQPLNNNLKLQELLFYQAKANKELNIVRIIPQVHKLVNWK